MMTENDQKSRIYIGKHPILTIKSFGMIVGERQNQPPVASITAKFRAEKFQNRLKFAWGIIRGRVATISIQEAPLNRRSDPTPPPISDPQSEGLRPCPFCGVSPIDYDGDFRIIHDSQCWIVQMGFTNSGEHWICSGKDKESWNTRNEFSNPQIRLLTAADHLRKAWVEGQKNEGDVAEKLAEEMFNSSVWCCGCSDSDDNCGRTYEKMCPDCRNEVDRFAAIIRKHIADTDIVGHNVEMALGAIMGETPPVDYDKWWKEQGRD